MPKPMYMMLQVCLYAMGHPLGKPLLLSLSGHPLGQAVLLLLFTTAALPLSCTVYWFLGSTSSENRHSGLTNKRLRPKNLPVWLNLARFINKYGISEINENLQIIATFDVFWTIHRPRKGYCVSTEALGMGTGWWPSSKSGPLTPPPLVSGSR